MARPATDGKGKGKGGGGDVSVEEQFLPNLITRLMGNATNTLKRRGFDTTGDTGGLTTALSGLIREQGTLKAVGLDVVAAAVMAGTSSLASTYGVPPAVTMVLREVLDEGFDDLGKAYASGRITQADANKIVQETSTKLNERLEKQMSFDWALQFLTPEEQEIINERIAAFRQNEADREGWDDFWRLKLNKPNLITPLLAVPVTRWRAHLEGIFGKPPVGAGKKAAGFLATLMPKGIIPLLLGKGDDPSTLAVREAAATYTTKRNKSTDEARDRTRTLRAINDKRWGYADIGKRLWRKIWS